MRGFVEAPPGERQPRGPVGARQNERRPIGRRSQEIAGELQHPASHVSNARRIVQFAGRREQDVSGPDPYHRARQTDFPGTAIVVIDDEEAMAMHVRRVKRPARALAAINAQERALMRSKLDDGRAHAGHVVPRRRSDQRRPRSNDLARRRQEAAPPSSSCA